MIIKKNDYKDTASFGVSDYKELPKGGYICRILKAEEIADKNGSPMVHIAFDICDGEFAGHFMNLFQSRKKASERPLEVKYPFEGQMWIGVNDYTDPSKTSKKFKGFCTALEESGTQVWSPRGEFMLMNLANAELGIVYQNVESEYEGKTRWRAQPWACRSVGAIESGDFFVPDDKALEKRQNNNASNDNGNFGVDSFATLEQDLPF